MAAGKYAPLPGSQQCLVCGAGTYESNSGLSECSDCGPGIFPNEIAYMGWCSVRRTEFNMGANSTVIGNMYSGPGNTTWFNVALETISLRAMLDSVRIDWTVGTQVRIGSALGQTHPLNPVVLRRIGIGLWSSANVDTVHTTNSTRYYMLL